MGDDFHANNTLTNFDRGYNQAKACGWLAEHGFDFISTAMDWDQSRNQSMPIKFEKRLLTPEVRLITTSKQFLTPLTIRNYVGIKRDREETNTKIFTTIIAINQRSCL